MRMNTEVEAVSTTLGQSKDFSIQNNGKMFEILSSKIYQYKVAAVVREICANAADSHVFAGCSERPFTVALPTKIRPEFSVEDFGTGLTREEVETIYTTYGASTKTDTDDVVGAYGIGSKTPFSYTNSFTIRTRKDGVETSFLAYIGDEGQPTISLLSESNTDAENGTKVSISVNELDFSEFWREASFLLSFYKTRPVVKPEHEFQFDFGTDHLDELENNGVTLMKDMVGAPCYRSDYSFAVMGGVPYPFSLQDIQSPNQDAADTSALDFLRESVLGKSRIMFQFEVGEVDISASRESLSVQSNSPGANRLSSRVIKLAKDFLQSAQSEVDACTSIMEATKLVDNKYGLGSMEYFTYGGEGLRSIMNKENIGNDLPGGYIASWQRNRSNNRTDCHNEITANPRVANRVFGSFIIAHPEKDGEDIRGKESKAKRWAKRQETTVMAFSQHLSHKDISEVRRIMGVSHCEVNTFQHIRSVESDERRRARANDGLTLKETLKEGNILAPFVRLQGSSELYRSRCQLRLSDYSDIDLYVAEEVNDAYCVSDGTAFSAPSLRMLQTAASGYHRDAMIIPMIKKYRKIIEAHAKPLSNLIDEGRKALNSGALNDEIFRLNILQGTRLARDPSLFNVADMVPELFSDEGFRHFQFLRDRDQSAHVGGFRVELLERTGGLDDLVNRVRDLRKEYDRVAEQIYTKFPLVNHMMIPVRANDEARKQFKEEFTKYVEACKAVDAEQES